MNSPMFSYRALCRASLIRIAEFDELNDAEQSAITDDFTQTCRDEQDMSTTEYMRRIGAGNLKSYAACLLV